MNVLGWLGDYSACGHYRIYLPFKENGWDITDRGLTSADVIVGQRVCGKVASDIFQQVCADDSKAAVLELDDDLFCLDPSHPAARRFNDPGLQARLRRNIEQAQLVTVSTEPLAAVCRQYSDNVVVLPNYVPAELLDLDWPASERVVIGWAGSATHSRDFGELAKPLKRILQKFGDRVEFHCLGHDYTPRVQSIRSRTRVTGWIAQVEDYYSAIDFDIALAPLSSSTFNASKSDLRLREMSALGLPTVASDFGPYADSIAKGCPAIPAGSHKAWERALTELIEDAECRRHAGNQAREWAAQHTIESNAWRWERAYRSVLVEDVVDGLAG